MFRNELVGDRLSLYSDKVTLVEVDAMDVSVVVATITVIIVLAVGAWTTTVGSWYRHLRKPSWNPPDWVFGPAWAIILALAAWSGVWLGKTPPTMVRVDILFC